jgi:hypothetical protein
MCEQNSHFSTGWSYDQIAAFGFDNNLCRRPQQIINRLIGGKRDSVAVSEGLYNRRPSMIAQPHVTEFHSDGHFLIIAELPVGVTGGHKGFGRIAPFKGDTTATLIKHQRAGCGILIMMFGDRSAGSVPPDRIVGWRHRQQTRNEHWNNQQQPRQSGIGAPATYRQHAPRQPFEHRQHDIRPKREQVLAGGHGHAYGRTIAMVDLITLYGLMGLAELSLIALRNGAAGDGRRPQGTACQRTKGSCFRLVVPLVASANGGGWERGCATSMR